MHFFFSWSPSGEREVKGPELESPWWKIKTGPNGRKWQCGTVEVLIIAGSSDLKMAFLPKAFACVCAGRRNLWFCGIVQQQQKSNNIHWFFFPILVDGYKGNVYVSGSDATERNHWCVHVMYVLMSNSLTSAELLLKVHPCNVEREHVDDRIKFQRKQKNIFSHTDGGGR